MHQDLRMATSHAATKERSSRTVWCVASQQWTTELLIIALMQYRTYAGQAMGIQNQYLPRRTGRKTHKKLNMNLSQIFPIEVGCEKV